MMKGRTMGHGSVVAVLAVLALAAGAARAQEGPPAPEPAPAPAGPSEGASVPAGLATLPDTLAGAVGTWDLSRQGGMRRCVLTLSPETGASGRVARFPAGCRRALPIMAGITGWLFTSEGLRLVDRHARPLLAFARSPDGMSFGAAAEDGERYDLVPLQIAAMQPPTAAPANAAAPAAVEAGAAPPALPPDGPAPGLYALDRAGQKDVCRLELSPPSEAEKDKTAVRVLPDCRDSGIAVFDPVTWRFANGHLTLKARRGHAVNLVSIGEGRWRRDPDIGVSLELRKVEP